MRVAKLDHLVLTVADVQATCAFYEKALGMQAVEFKPGRWALAFQGGKLNLHQAGHEFEPKAHRPTPGSADLCFLVLEPVAEVALRLQASGVEIIEGPVERSGSQGPLLSIYLRDPDFNLIELSNPLYSV